VRLFLVLHLNIAIFNDNDAQVYERHAKMRAVLFISLIFILLTAQKIFAKTLPSAIIHR